VTAQERECLEKLVHKFSVLAAREHDNHEYAACAAYETAGYELESLLLVLRDAS